MIPKTADLIAIEEFMAKTQSKDEFGYLEPSCRIIHGFSWTPESGVVKDAEQF